MTVLDHNRLADALLPAILAAGRLEMAHFAAGVAIEKKADRSPVTIADREAEAIIVAALHAVAPHIPVVAEEAVSAGNIPAPSETFFLVDALDGTHMFIRGKPEFSVNIALVENAKSVFGVIYVPPTGALYVTRQKGGSYQCQVDADAPADDLAGLRYTQLVSRVPNPANLAAFNSRAAGGACADFLAALGVREAKPLGSSMKFGLIAAGKGDLYARFGDTHEWDTAAGQAILEAAGGCVTTLDGVPLTYGHAARRYLNPHFVAWGGQPLKPQVPGLAPERGL